MLIAKYRKAEYPNEWFLTDFTMDQVEGRIELLEGDLSREIDHSRFLEKVLEAMLGEKFDKITLFEASKLRHAIISKIDESCRPTVEQLQEEQSALVEDLVHKANLLRITEKALEDIRAICISSMYWKNDKYPSCARILAHHHKIVTSAQVKIAELTAIEYGDDVEAEHS